MGLLYDVETHTVNYHLKQIFADHELPADSVIRNFRITAAAGKSYDVSTYLDVAEDMALRQIPMTHAGLGKPLRRGWCLGGKDFRKELLAEMPGRTGPHHAGEDRRATVEAWAEKLLAEALRRAGWTVQG